MKPFQLLRFLITGLALWLAPLGSAQTVEGPAGVAVTFKALDLQWGYSGSGYEYLDLGVDGLNGYQTVSAALYDSETAQLTVRLEPGKTYWADISSDDLNDLTLQAVPPPGYVMEIEQVARERLVLGYAGYATIRIRVLAPMQQYNGRAGTATALTSGRIYWQVALGALANGSSAGALAIIDTGAGNFSSLFSPAGFHYEPTSSEVQVYYNPWNVSAPEIPGAIRQIIAPEACADIVTIGPNEAHIKFYHREQLVPGSGFRSFTGDPFAWYLINQDGAQPDRVFINCDLRDLPNPTATGVAVVKTKHTVLDRTGSAPNFTWTADEWYDDGASSLSREVHVRSNGTEAITVSQPGGATATSASRTYASVPWGEEIVSETRGTTDPVTTSTEFYTTSDQAGDYGRPRSTITTGGSWEAYEYYDYAGGTADVAGALHRSHRPWLNSDTAIPANLASHSGVVTTYAYAADAFGRRTRPTAVSTTIGGVTTSSVSTSYSDAASGFSGHPYLYLVTATSAASTSASDTLTTVSKYFREDAGAFSTYATDDFFRSQLHSVQHPDGRKQSFVYQRGTWDGTTFTPSTNGGTDYGAASRIAVINGTTTATGSYCSSYAGYSVDGLYLVDGKSTMEVTIRDASALVRRTETQVWSSGAWQLVSSVTYGYNYSNQLTSRTTSNNGVYEASYTGELKNWEKDESGIRVDYTYDAAGRVYTATKSSGPTTTFSYDAEHRSLSENVTAAGTGENIYTARTYDDAGRLRTELPVGMTTVTHSYTPASRTRTTTYPDASARTEAFYADGQPDSVTGSAVVPQYFGYTIETDGRRTTQVWSGYSGSPRWQKATTDWLGRTLQTERPGFSITAQANSVEAHTYEPGTGRLTKTTRTGLAPTRYEYDALSNVVRSGLDIGDDGLGLASMDRITDSDRLFENDGGWWLKATTTAYPYANSATAVITSVSRQRLSGHPANQLDESQVTDAEGNTVTRTVVINRTTATATITTTRPGVSNAQVETIVNGLATSVLGHDGLTSSAQYDALSRAWKSTDPRSNVTTTTYKYGTALVQSVTDGAGNSLGTVSYDGMGRKQWAQDAAGQYTRFGYNARGQLTQQWGGGTYPVSYDYDATYGDRTTLNTYRAAPAGDSASWPAVGVADTTTWAYDPATGLLWKKTDSGNQVTEFDYNVRGQTSSRKWARTLVSNGAVKLTSTYGYDGNTGELLTQTYNDGADPIPTPSVSYGGSYTRLGQVGTVTDGTGTRTFNYNSTAPWRLDNETLDAGFYASRMLTRQYDAASGTGGSYGPYTPGTFKGRYVGYDLGVSGNTARDQHVAYTTSNLARFVGVYTRTTTGSGRDYVYNYYGSSSLIGGYTMGSFNVVRGYESQRNVLTSLDSRWNASSLTRFDYTANALGQRTTAKQSGSAYADYTQGLGYSATFNVYNYNARGELQTAARYRGDNPTTSPAASDELPAQRFEYRYDSIGNRKTAGATGTAADDGYTTNALNQYTDKDNKTVKVVGTAAANATVAVSGVSSMGKKDRAWGVDFAPANSGGPAQGTATAYAAVAGGGTGGADLVRADSKSWFIPKLSQHIDYDADGNMTGDGVWTYTYNAENQLVRMTSVLPAGFTGRHLRLDFKYDYQGRRVEKRVYDNDTSTETLARRFLYDGWNLIAETDIAGNLQRTFTWGLDLVGSLSASGGVGALLQIDQVLNPITQTADPKTYLASYDGNGNLAALVNAATGALAAAYEYDPSGNLLRSEGAYAKDNPFRFSTKWQDDETGLINFGFRYYSPTLGRFINQDPIAEQGGLNLYGFCGNNGVNRWDYLGMLENEEENQDSDGGAWREWDSGYVIRLIGGGDTSRIAGFFDGSFRGVQAVEKGSAVDFKRSSMEMGYNWYREEAAAAVARDLAKLDVAQKRLIAGQTVTVTDKEGDIAKFLPNEHTDAGAGIDAVPRDPETAGGLQQFLRKNHPIDRPFKTTDLAAIYAAQFVAGSAEINEKLGFLEFGAGIYHNKKTELFHVTPITAGEPGNWYRPNDPYYEQLNPLFTQIVKKQDPDLQMVSFFHTHPTGNRFSGGDAAFIRYYNLESGYVLTPKAGLLKILHEAPGQYPYPPEYLKGTAVPGDP